MSWATCYSGSNNIHFEFPPIMADGRNYASWQPEAVINERIQKKEHITSNWQYRQYLTNNGVKIMNYNNISACYDLGMPCSVNSRDDNITQLTQSTPSSNVPILYKSLFDTGSPGYGYQNSDLKNPYLSRQQLEAKMISPYFTSNTLSQQFNINMPGQM
jgi:hypothetical protein